MPGILPMKVIKVGNSAQSRIAQACDRCRSKKIRCDGVRPTCSQCANVGFECRTSDKLSRRAFPRGYTESLEERVRQLESEVRELKDLLDEKDEKIDMLSAMHSGRRRASVTSATTPAPSDLSKDSPPPKEDTFRLQASPLLLGVENSDAYFMGSSSGRSFIHTFKRKIQETGKPCSEFNPEAFLHMQGCAPLTSRVSAAPMRLPPRIFSDRCVNVYFQEWAPLFPILHKPTFLHIYEEFVADPEKVKNPYKVAQLYLVFSLAGLSASSPDLQQLAACEKRWVEALEPMLLENTMSTLQCVTLALLYFTLTADYRRLQHYKSIAVGLSQRLGLHQSQKRFSFGALTLETRKKVFWTLYTLDCFSAATLGLPKLFREEDVQTELPSDTDDEYITEKGFQPTLPGEHTRLSNALALFRAARILASVLEKNYPAATTYDLSLQQMRNLDAELESWYENLPPHLRLNFVQDKPSTDVTGSRSPFLAMTYYYIRTLIYRPAVGSSLGSKAAPALLSIADASKHMIQITQLLEERNLSFSFCLNKCDMLAMCALTLLYQIIDLKPQSKMMKDDERLVNVVVKMLDQQKAPGSIDLRKAALLLISVDGSSERSAGSASPSLQKAAASPSKSSSHGRRKSGSSSRTSAPQQHHKHDASSRRMTAPSLPAAESLVETATRKSFEIAHPEAILNAKDPLCLGLSDSMTPTSTSSASRTNLDYLSLGNTPSGSRPATPSRSRQRSTPTLMAHQTQVMSNAQLAAKMAGVASNEWEALLGTMDGGINNMYDAIYGGATLISEPALSNTTGSSEWSPDSWDLSTFNLGDFGATADAPQSVLSISEESLSSGEELATSDLSLGQANVDFYKLPSTAAGGESFTVDNLEGFIM